MTVQQAIERALRLIGAIDPDENATASEVSTGIISLNNMLDGWSLTRQGVYRQVRESFDLVAGTGSYTIGSGQTFDTTRPHEITSAFIRLSNQDYYLRIRSGEWYDEFTTDKTVQGLPYELFYDPSAATSGTIYLAPVPDSSAYDLHIRSHKPYTDYSSGSESLGLPTEYEAAIPWNLAVDLAPEYQAQPSAIVLKRADETLKAAKRLHLHPIPQTETDVVNSNPRRFIINRGY